MIAIGVVPAPLEWPKWEQAKAFLEPARARGDFPKVIEPDEEMFAVFDGDELMACATAWFNADENYVEVKLVGGRDHRRWLKELDEYIGAAASEAGATRMVAIGRRGWARSLRALGWDSIGVVDGSTIYQRALEN